MMVLMVRLTWLLQSMLPSGTYVKFWCPGAQR
jgi:hypothetical protein